MKNLEYIADELFNKIRGRYPSVTVGDNDATITNMPKQGRFFEFDFQPGKKVSISLDEDGIAVMYSTKLFDSNNASLKSNWFGFLKESTHNCVRGISTILMSDLLKFLFQVES